MFFNLNLENFNSISFKSYLLRAFPKISRACPKKIINFYFDLDNFFIGKNCSIFNNFPTLGQNIMKPIPCTLIH